MEGGILSYAKLSNELYLLTNFSASEIIKRLAKLLKSLKISTGTLKIQYKDHEVLLP